MADKTHWKKAVAPGDYLGAYDFQEGEEKVVTIKSVNQAETIVTNEGKSQHAVVHFTEDVKPLLLNVTNSKAITKVASSPYFEDWPGNPIQLYVDPNVRAFGETVSAVRVRPRKPVIKQGVKCAECGSTIQAASGKGAEYIAKYTQQKFGVSLCFQCASKRSAPATEGKNDG